MLLCNVLTNPSISNVKIEDGKAVFYTNYEQLDTPMVVRFHCTVDEGTEETKIETPIAETRVSVKVAFYTCNMGKYGKVYNWNNEDKISIKGFDESDGDMEFSDIIVDRMLEPGNYLIMSPNQQPLNIKKYYRNDVITFHELHKHDVSWKEHSDMIKQIRLENDAGNLSIYPLIPYERLIVQDQILPEKTNEFEILVTTPPELKDSPLPILFRLYYEITTSSRGIFKICYIAVSKNHVEANSRQEQQAESNE